MRSILFITFLTLTLAVPATAADYSVTGIRPISKAAKNPNRGDMCEKKCHRTGIAQLKCICECNGGIWRPDSHHCG